MIVEIKADDLENVNGGYIFEKTYRGNITGYEVIDDKTGDVVKTFDSYDVWSAECWAKRNGYSVERISWEDLRLLRVKGPKIGELPEIKGPQIGNPPMGQ